MIPTWADKIIDPDDVSLTYSTLNFSRLNSNMKVNVL